jgi:hypothetical protein
MSLTSAPDGGERSVLLPGRSIAEERDQGTHSTRGFMGPREGFDAKVKREISALAGNRTPVLRQSSP